MNAIGMASFAGLALVVGSAGASEVVSEYTPFDRGADCTVVASSRDEGDWHDLVCAGYRGYPILIVYSDGREVASYGFAPVTRMPNIMPFNEAMGPVEWRIKRNGEVAVPFAAIQRWHLSHPEGADGISEMLVVSRVGQPKGGGACAIAFIPASGNPSANERARAIADARAEAFQCGVDKIEIDPAVAGMVARQ